MLNKNSRVHSALVDQGIEITPIPVTEGARMTIKYDGLLVKSGADKLYAHCGYGTGLQWKNIRDIPMMQTADGWICQADAKEQRFNFCFHDSANNWDNNNGLNWSVTIHSGSGLS